ncbi:hypothetical protein DHW03_16990 [Pedobacter yonginense]|uniref:Uncharacterized protein n=1 Tax=Pedobacter yonginense TaxID=651869 RepID=A0A317EIT8_9SPHI|nr:hypothetical protein [Pedobacter yonginense]PWS26474.1 hypothetical protein DHW03_16990 [Pedobacter yonginense]
MNLKELLLKGQNFISLLNEFRIDAKDLIIKDEETIFSNQTNNNTEVVKESVWIEGKSNEGLVNLFGTLHYNLLNKLAVFEMQGYEKVSA